MKIVPAEIFRLVAENYENPFMIFNEDGILYSNPRADYIVEQNHENAILNQLLKNKDESEFLILIPGNSKYLRVDIGSGSIGKNTFYFATFHDNKLSYKNLLLSYIIKKSSVSIIVFDKNRKITYINEFGLNLYGYTEKELLGKPFEILSGEKDRKRFIKNCIEQADATGVWRGEDYRKNKNGKIFPSSAAITRMVDENNIFLGYYDASRDNSIRFKEKKELEILSRKDELTGIPNRRYLFLMLEQQWNFTLLHQIPFTVLFADIDDFKSYNDTYGHLAGDRVLVNVARTIQKNLRSSDFIARYGGEEFIAILVGASKEKTRQIADKILKAINDIRIPHEASGVADHVTISLGICHVTPDTTQNGITCVHNADKALYKAKRNGKNRYDFYEPEDDGVEQHNG